MNIRRCLAEGDHYSNYAVPVFTDFFFSIAKDVCQREMAHRQNKREKIVLGRLGRKILPKNWNY
jgi:hypothetical protein